MSISIKSVVISFTALCLSLAAGVLIVDQVQALSSKAPDTNSGGGYGTSNSRFVLERTGQNTVTSIQVPVYIPNKPTGAVSMSAVDFYYPWSSNKPKVSFQGGSYTSSAKNFTIPRASFVEDKTTGYWKAFATAKLESVGVSTYNVAEFRLRVNVGGGLIGIGGGKRYSTIPQNYYTTNNNDTYEYNIPFATPCNVNSNTIKSIALDDLDSGTVDNRYNSITVRAYDETAGAYVSLTQVSGSSMSGDYKANMTFKPGHKYRLRVSGTTAFGTPKPARNGGVHANNTLMYTFPYDNIAYKVGCAWSLLGINSQNRVQVGGSGGFSGYGNYHQGSPRTVRPGDNVQFQHQVKNSGNMETSNFSRWRERNGWQGTSGWPQSGGTFQSTLDAFQSVRWPGAPTSYKIKPSDVGRTLCERYGVRGQSNTNGNAYRSIGSCVRVTASWSIGGVTTVNKTTVAVGESITWTHELTNAGPDMTHQSIVSKVGRSGFASNTDISSATTAAGKAKGVIRSKFTTTYVAKAADVGKTVCQRLKWSPRSSTNSAENMATNRCVTIRASWDLKVTSLNSNQSAAPGVYGAYPYASPRMVDAGDGIIFRHTVKNDGIKTSAGFDRWSGRSRFAGTSATWVLFGTRTSGNTVNSGATRTWNSPSYTAKASTLGRILCERHSVQGRSSMSSAARASTGSCITVRENYKLTPSIPLTSKTVAPGDSIAPFRPTVMNRMDVPVKTTATLTDKDWQVVRFKLEKGVAIPGPSAGTGTPCSYISGRSGENCQPVSQGKKVFAVNNNLLDVISGQVVDDDLQMGEKVCFMAAVRPHSSATPGSEWGYSQSVCLTVGKTPMVQVWGGDVRAGSIRTGMSGGSVTYGSWGEYGVFARSDNNDMASGSGWIDGKPSADKHHHLTFANVASAGSYQYGNFDFAAAAPLRLQFTALTETGAMASQNVGTASTAAINVFRPTSNVTLDASTLPVDKTTIINAAGRTVTINGDLTYADSALSSTGQIPQLIIIAKDINIAESVKRVDAWLLASGWIDTCSTRGIKGALPTSGVLSARICEQQLVVNGPVATNKLVLKRTGGAEADAVGVGRGEPAERFNLRPDAYMWLYSFSNRQAQAWTTGINELPVRY